MTITIVSDAQSWLNSYIGDFARDLRAQSHIVVWEHDPIDILPSDVCFLLSLGKIVPKGKLLQNKNNIVVHESKLPKGRGWSPLTWQILEGQNTIPITLFEASETIDSGLIYLQDYMYFNGSELIDELRHTQALKTMDLCFEFLQKYPQIIDAGVPQIGEPTYYSRRTPNDSRISIDSSIRQSFSLLRVVDNQRYPAFFIHESRRFVCSIQKTREMISSMNKVDIDCKFESLLQVYEHDNIHKFTFEHHGHIYIIDIGKKIVEEV